MLFADVSKRRQERNGQYMENWLSRTELLIGKQVLEKLQNSTVAVFGCGGVGSYSIEALARARYWSPCFN